MGPLYLLFLLLVPPLLFIIAISCKSQNNSSLPCPRKLPVIGNLHQLGAHPHRSLHKLSLKYGPLMLLQLGSIPTLIISTADALREVFKAHDLAFSSRPSLYATTKFSYGSFTIAFAPYGDFWREARKVCISEILSVKRVQSFHKIREEEVADLISGIKKACSSSVPVNLNKILHAVTNKIVSRVMFGDKVATPEHGEILVETQRLLGEFWVVDYLPWLGWIDALTGLRGRLAKNLKQLDEFYEHVIIEHTRGDAQEHELHDLVHVLLQLQKDPIHGKTFSSTDHIKGIITVWFSLLPMYYWDVVFFLEILFITLDGDVSHLSHLSIFEEESNFNLDA
jgi:cytochrome P450 family 71 subfamily A